MQFTLKTAYSWMGVSSPFRIHRGVTFEKDTGGKTWQTSRQDKKMSQEELIRRSMIPNRAGPCE